MIKLEKAILCLLHFDNHGSKAFIMHLFLRALHLVEGDKEAATEQRLFGKPGCPSSWKFPLDSDGTLADATFANWCT